MKLHSISIKNFQSYPDVEQTIPLDKRGVTLLVGPNGAGKSTWFSALVWGLYGKTIQDKVEDVVNRLTKKNCKVTIKFSIKDKQYTLYRYRAHDTHGNDLLLFEGEKNITLKGADKTQQLLLDIIEIPYQAFVNTVVFSSELYSFFFRSRASDRLKILENILSLKEISVYYEATKKEVAQLNERISSERLKKVKLESSCTSLEETNHLYKENAKNTLLRFKQEKEKINAEIEKLTKEISDLDKINVDLELSNIQKIEENKRIEAEISRLKSLIVDVEQLEKNLAILRKEKETLDKINIEEETENFLAREAIKEKIKNYIHKKELCTIEDSSYKKEILNKKKFSYDSIIEEIKSLTVNKCPVCHRELDEENRIELVKKYETSANELKKEIIDLEKELISIEEKNRNTKEELNKIDSTIEKLKEEFEFIDARYSSHDEISKVSFRKESVDKDIEHTFEKVNSIKKSNNDLMVRVKELCDDLHTVVEQEYTVEFLTSLKEQFNIKTKSIADKKAEMRILEESAKNAYDKNFIKVNESKIEKIKSAITILDTEIGNLESELKYYNVFMNIFSNKESGFKKYFISKMIFVLNESLDFYLKFLFDININVSFDKDLNEKIIVDGNEVSFKSFSSGQKTRLEIAASLALFNLAKTFFSNDTDLLVFDEILDMNLDNLGFNSVIDIIEGMSAEHNIFIISHQEEYKERFKSKIEIKTDPNGFSFVA